MPSGEGNKGGVGTEASVKHGNSSAAAASRYVVGFDLGTTNSAVTYVDTAERAVADPRRLPFRSWLRPGQVEARETLPSFHYQPAAGELAAGALRCPWHKTEPSYAVGFFARDHGRLVPGRLINSAKSWLCHSGVDRTAPLLPWHGAADVERLSPVEVSARYLAHVRDAWNARFPRDPLAEQEFVLTLPASFDEVARELTVKAAALAGLPRVVLIEEPQAAFYAWIYAHADDWDRLVDARPEDSRLRHRRRHLRFHVDPRPPRRRGQGPVPSRGRRRPLDPRRRQSRPGAGPVHRAEDRQAGAAAMGRAGANLPRRQGDVARARRPRETHA